MAFHFDNHHPIFHVREGLSFRRRPTGDVRLEVDGRPFYFTEHEWASVVAFLSHDGENAETSKAALDLYNGESATEKSGLGAEAVLRRINGHIGTDPDDPTLRCIREEIEAFSPERSQ